MSFDISAIGTAQGTGEALGAAHSVPAPQEPEPVEGSEAVTIDTFPATPPPEVHEAISVAARASQSLADRGQHLHFTLNPSTGSLTVELQDANGNHLSTLTPTEVLAVAAGEDLG
jgi:hypothetical protein